MKKILFILLIPLIVLGQTFEEFYNSYSDKDLYRARKAYENYLNSTYAYYFLLSNKTYKVSGNQSFIADAITVIENPTIMKETNIVNVAKPNWVLLAEQLYIKNLTEIGYVGAWTNMSITFEDIGLDLLLKVDQTTNSTLSDFSNKKKSVLESLYLNLKTYANEYNITDMRLFPYGSSNIIESTNTKDYILYNSEKYYKE